MSGHIANWRSQRLVRLVREKIEGLVKGSLRPDMILLLLGTSEDEQIDKCVEKLRNIIK